MNAVPRSASPWRIVRNPKVCGGEPTVDGTRIPVSAIVVQWRYYRNVDCLLSAFPSLDRDAIGCALDYYGQNKAEIDRLIDESEQAANTHR
ncbi:MAG TPA: DUF433 domain-containing protein [Chloroflexota bacterium]|nr:DUF433 domain-containing protein [Chloroflexota bacterium]